MTHYAAGLGVRELADMDAAAAQQLGVAEMDAQLIHELKKESATPEQISAVSPLSPLHENSGLA